MDIGTHTEPRTKEKKETLGQQLDKSKVGDTVTMEWSDTVLPEVGKTYSRGWDWSRWKAIKVEGKQITFQKQEDGAYHRD